MRSNTFIFTFFFMVATAFIAQAQTILDLANQKRLAGQYEAAITDYTQVIGQAPNLAAAYAERGYCFAKLKRYQEALSDLEKAIDLGFKDPLVFLNRGWAKYNLGDKQGACADWQQAEQQGYSKAGETIAAYCQQ